jgi:hypothetical protein
LAARAIGQKGARLAADRKHLVRKSAVLRRDYRALFQRASSSLATNLAVMWIEITAIRAPSQVEAVGDDGL